MKHYLDSKLDINDQGISVALDELPLWSAPFGLKLLENVRLGGNLNVLDIGFGTGFPLIELSMRMGESSKLFGLDLWEQGIARAKKKIKYMNLKNIEIINGSAEKMPFEDGFFDVIVSNNGITNAENLPPTISECRRVLKKGGQLLFTCNLKDTMKEFYTVLQETLKELGLADAVTAMKAHIYEKRKPLKEMENLLKDNDFEIRQIIEDKFRLRYVDGTALFNHFLIRVAFLPSWRKIVPDDMLETVFSKVEEKLNVKAKEKGELSLTIPFVLIDSTGI